jgi:multiple sugar transport system permease protein
MLMLYAALQTLDQAQIEAAQIDGAGGWRVVRHIVLPALVPVIVFTVSVRLMDVFRFFDSIYVLTGGGPGTATETITMYTYQLGFQLLQVGKASALGIITLIIVAAIIATFSRMLQRAYGRSP